MSAKKPCLMILHIEDDPDQREMMARVIRKKYRYEGVESGESAEALLLDKALGLIILDLALPLMNGFEFLKKNKRFIADRNIPVIVTTGLEGEGVKSLCRDHLCDTYYKKPLDVHAVSLRIAELID